MRTAISRQQGLAVCMVGIALAMTGCGGHATSADPAGTAGSRPATTALGQTPAVTPPSTPDVGPVTGQAHGGGDFCKLAASASASPAIGGTSVAEIQKRIAAVRVEEQQALDLAPASIKSDVTLLFAASNSVYDALAKVSYDYSKLKPADMSALEAPAVVAAEKHLTTYVTDVCKIS